MQALESLLTDAASVRRPDQLAIVLTPLMGEVKGTVGPDFVIPCVDFELDVTVAQTARGAVADCQRMVWQRRERGTSGRALDGRPGLRTGNPAVGVAGHRHRDQRRLPRPARKAN